MVLIVLKIVVICNNSCFKENDECIQHLFKKNYYSLKCENKCNKNCINGCDLYNGFY